MQTTEERLRDAALELRRELAAVRIPESPRSRRSRVGAAAAAVAVVALFAAVTVILRATAFAPTTPASTTMAATSGTSMPSRTTLGPPAASFPESGPTFGRTTGIVLFLNDGVDGITAVDLDRRLVSLSTVEGRRVGDEFRSIIRVGDKLVVGWGQPHAVDLATRQVTILGTAMEFLPATEPDRVWLVDYPSRSIGVGAPVAWQVDMSGTVLSEPKELPAGIGLPVIGIQGGLALQTVTGLRLWDAASGEVTRLEGPGPGIASDAAGTELAWCSGKCTQLMVTDTSTLESEAFDPPQGYGFTGTAAFSPTTDSLTPRHLAALVGKEGEEGIAIVIFDRETDTSALVSDPDTSVTYLAWAPDGRQLFATSYSYGESLTTVWRYDLTDQALQAVVLPIGGALRPVAVEASTAEAYIGNRVGTASQCPSPDSPPSDPSGICTIGY
ncbi:MAG: hypothetical protein KJ698_04870 [Actinobacteria bacterium]|nr:hypothetical protein [Actinomycetota bacterium]